jgi:hypothetical protein
MAQFTYQVEQLGTTFTELLKIGNFPSPLLEASPVSKSTNTRPHSNLTIEDLKQTDKELLKKAEEQLEALHKLKLYIS